MTISAKKFLFWFSLCFSLFLAVWFYPGQNFFVQAACPACNNEVPTVTTVYNSRYSCTLSYCLGFCSPVASYDSITDNTGWDPTFIWWTACSLVCAGGSTDCGMGGTTITTTSCVPYSDPVPSCSIFTTASCSGTSINYTNITYCPGYCSSGTYIPSSSTVVPGGSFNCANQNYWSAPYYYCSGDSVMYDRYYNQYTCSGGACSYAGSITYTYTAQNCANQNYTETGCQGDSSYVRNVSYTCSGAACSLLAANITNTPCTDSWVYGAPFSGCGGADGKQLCTYQTRYYYESVCSVNACTTPTITQTETLTLGCSYQIGQCGVQCLSATDCNDGSACTGDICSNYTCSNPPLCTAGQICDPAIGCITPACSSNAECGISNACITYTCNNPGTPSASCSLTPVSCPPGQICDPSIGCYTPLPPPPPPPNQPPIAAISCDPSLCGSTDCIAYTGCVFTLNNNSTDPDGQNDIASSEWDIFGWNGDPDFSCSSPNARCNYTLPILAPGAYTAELLVRDQADASSSITQSFWVRQEASAGFMCSLNNTNWQVCENLRPTSGQLVYFKDGPPLSEYSRPSEGATNITSRTWRINGNVFDSGNNTNPSVNLTNTGSNTIRLTIIDNQGRTDSQDHTISVGLPLPEWKEVPPTSWLKNFLASISGFVINIF